MALLAWLAPQAPLELLVHQALQVQLAHQDQLVRQVPMALLASLAPQAPLDLLVRQALLVLPELSAQALQAHQVLLANQALLANQVPPALQAKVRQAPQALRVNQVQRAPLAHPVLQGTVSSNWTRRLARCSSQITTWPSEPPTSMAGGILL